MNDTFKTLPSFMESGYTGVLQFTADPVGIMAKRLLVSLSIGVMVTVLLTSLALVTESKAITRLLVWQAYALMKVLPSHLIPTPYGPVPMDSLGFVIGLALGVPIYAGIAYRVLPPLK